jgi:SAM-dependent methyltransferase
MRLSAVEFKAMNNPVRRFFQKYVEFQNFKRLGLTDKNKDILEIGCGSGYGAVLLSALEPRTYIGVDVMPEQILLTCRWPLPGFQFKVMDASDMPEIPALSRDIVVIFGILHHIPPWRKVIKECRRILRPGGKLFVEEPDGRVIRNFDRLFHWGHAETDFSLNGFEKELADNGLIVRRKIRVLGLGAYQAQKKL